MKKVFYLLSIIFCITSCTSLVSRIENEQVLDFTYSIKTNSPNIAFDILMIDAFKETFGPYLQIDDNPDVRNGYAELIFLPSGPKTFIFPVNKSVYMIKLFSPDNELLWYGCIDLAGIHIFSYSQYKEIKKVNKRLLDLLLDDTGISIMWTEAL